MLKDSCYIYYLFQFIAIDKCFLFYTFTGFVHFKDFQGHFTRIFEVIFLLLNENYLLLILLFLISIINIIKWNQSTITYRLLLYEISGNETPKIPLIP